MHRYLVEKKDGWMDGPLMDQVGGRWIRLTDLNMQDEILVGIKKQRARWMTRPPWASPRSLGWACTRCWADPTLGAR